MGAVGVGLILGVQVGQVQRVAVGTGVLDGVRVMVGEAAGAGVLIETGSGVLDGVSGVPTAPVGSAPVGWSVCVTAGCGVSVSWRVWRRPVMSGVRLWVAPTCGVGLKRWQPEAANKTSIPNAKKQSRLRFFIMAHPCF